MSFISQNVSGKHVWEGPLFVKRVRQACSGSMSGKLVYFVPHYPKLEMSHTGAMASHDLKLDKVKGNWTK